MAKKSRKPRKATRFAVVGLGFVNGGLRTSAKPTNNNLVTRGPTRLPTLPRPQRCGLTRVCSAAAEADVIVVIQVTLKRTKHVAKSAAGKYVAISPCHASGSRSGKLRKPAYQTLCKPLSCHTLPIRLGEVVPNFPYVGLKLARWGLWQPKSTTCLSTVSK